MQSDWEEGEELPGLGDCVSSHFPLVSGFQWGLCVCVRCPSPGSVLKNSTELVQEPTAKVLLGSLRHSRTSPVAVIKLGIFREMNTELLLLSHSPASELRL